jgi:phosphate transport system substrate-binding protein
MEVWQRFTTIIIALMLLLGGCASANKPLSIVGAGASFPGPVYRAWAIAGSTSMNMDIRYEEVGSTAGIARIKSGTVDFGASGIPLGGEELPPSKRCAPGCWRRREAG